MNNEPKITITVEGPAGIGKSGLAIRIAQSLRTSGLQVTLDGASVDNDKPDLVISSLLARKVPIVITEKTE